jgi:Uncharacterized alpha/beta hydrolase domain (DUF2235)
MMCTPCVLLAIFAAVVVVGLLLSFKIVRKAVRLSLKAVKIAIGLLLLVALIAVPVLCVYVNEAGRVGAVLGLLLGTLLAPIRIAGVDFRQWFMDPGSPSELGDDSFIGLIRWGFHALWIPWFVTIVVLIGAASWWMPQSCRPVEISPVLHHLLDPIRFGAAADFLAGVVTACSGFYGGLNLFLGTMLAATVGPVLVEILWHFGLAHGVPARPAEYLAPQGLPRVRVKEVVPGFRRLIICCDGTWNWPEAKRETNVVRMVRALLPEHGDVSQIIHYHQGVGTGNFLDRVAGGGAGVGLSASVKACYGFLTDNYKQGDEIFLFGFSRGAFVVRSLAGMIGTVGLMRKDEMARFAEVWNWYCLGKDERERQQDILHQLAPHRHQDVDIECIGVWDTVGALGIPGSRLCAQAFEFHDTALGPHVRHAFQALAIDERRGNFQGAVWVPFVEARRPRGAPAAAVKQKPEPERRGPQQVLRQMWFPGVHSNIGGGYPKHGLSDTTFLWMLAQVWDLVGLDRDNVVLSLDNTIDRSEFYPIGELADSRTLGWKLIACPVPRPVGIISATERVHESAWGRSAAPLGIPANDAYKQQSRCDWLTAIGLLRAPRVPREEEIAGLPRPPDPPSVNIPRRLGPCGAILDFINPQS